MLYSLGSGDEECIGTGDLDLLWAGEGVLRRVGEDDGVITIFSDKMFCSLDSGDGLGDLEKSMAGKMALRWVGETVIGIFSDKMLCALGSVVDNEYIVIGDVHKVVGLWRPGEDDGVICLFSVEIISPLGSGDEENELKGEDSVCCRLDEVVTSSVISADKSLSWLAVPVLSSLALSGFEMKSGVCEWSSKSGVKPLLNRSGTEILPLRFR